MARPGHVQEFIDATLPAFVMVKNRFGFPPSAGIAQAALESAWGTSHFAKSCYNLFGIKKGPSSQWSGPTCFRQSDGSYFRKYGSWSESIANWAEFLSVNSRYNLAVANRADPYRFMWHIWQAGYAGDPNGEARDYYNKVVSIMEVYGLLELDGRKTSSTPFPPATQFEHAERRGVILPGVGAYYPPTTLQAQFQISPEVLDDPATWFLLSMVLYGILELGGTLKGE